MANPILYGDIQIQECEKAMIQQVRVDQEFNEHSKLSVVAIIKEEDLEIYEGSLFLSECIHVKEKETLIFCGIITQKTMRCMDNIHYLDITAFSHTYSMDIEAKSRSFQNVNMMYSNVIEEILAMYPKTVFMHDPSQDRKIGKPIIQYKETDWEFLKRIASHLHIGLVANNRGEGVRFSFGLPEVNKDELIAYDYSLEIDFNKYKKVSIDAEGLLVPDFTFAEVETDQIFDLGDKVVFKKKPLYVIKTSFEYNQAIIKNRCRLAPKGGASVNYMEHSNISGCSIFGKVIAVARDNVKIHLEFDESQSVDTAYWYPYASMYASNEETGWYCMPEMGDVVRLYHPEGSEEKAMAISSIKPHDPDEDVETVDPQHRMSNPDTKYIRTAFGKEIKFRTDGIDIIAKDGTVFMSLNDDGSVNLNSNDKISFTAENDIEMKARNVNIEALEHIKLKSKKSSIDMEQDIIIEGQEVKSN